MIEENNLHPVHQCNDGLFNSASGIKVDLLSPTADMISLHDIAKGLDNICRFGGQIKSRYTVCSHTLLVWYLAPVHLKEAALLHDAAEAYIGDVIKPLKVILEPIYGPIEARFEAVIFGKYNVNIDLLKSIKPYDKRALEIEHAYFHRDDKELIRKQYEIHEQLGVHNTYFALLRLLSESFGAYEIGRVRP